MSVLKRFLKDTIIYGLAAVLPKLMNFLLVRLHTETLPTADYSDNTTFYVYAAFLAVLLTYGMETAFFRYFSTEKEKGKVFSTTTTILTITTFVFFGLAWASRAYLAALVELDVFYFECLIVVMALDTLVVAPFAYLRANNQAVRFASLKMANITIYVLLNVFFLWAIPHFGWRFSFYEPEDLVQYIFIANIAGSGLTFLLLIPYFFKAKFRLDIPTLRQLWAYGWPIMVAGLAFVINEMLDKLFLKYMLDKDIMGAYAGCYKLAVFMTLFIQAFRLGAEPFFFNHAKEKNAKQTYAIILKYFVLVGTSGLLLIVLYIDFFKELLIGDPSYWRTLEIVPVILLANLCLGIYHNLAVWYKLTDKTRFGMYISLLGAVITIAFNWIFIPIIGFMASAWATLAAYGSMMVVSYLLGRNHYAVPYQTKRILEYLFLAVVLSAVSFYIIRDNFSEEKTSRYLINSALLFVFLAIAWFREKKELKRLLFKV